MTGFLRKDIYSLCSMYRKNLILVFLLYTVMTLAMNVTFLLYMMIWLMGFYSLSAITLDESSGWDRYARTLPASAGQIIGARFLATLLMVAVGVVFSLAVGLAACLMRKEAMGELLFAVPVVTAVALVCIGLLLPAAYKWGVEKARNTFLLLFMLVFFVPALLEKKMGGEAMLQKAAAFLDEQPPALLLGGALAIGLAVFFLGYLLSCTVYRNKVF